MATLTYRIDGPQGAPLLVLSNSLGTTWDMWNPQLATFRQHFRILRYDHRGHGQTPASAGPYTIADLGGDVLELLDGIGEQRASFCGLSLGGMVAMWIASHAPERVDRVVLASTSPVLGPAAPWAERAIAVRASGTGILLEALLGRWFTAGFPERRPDVASAVAGMLSTADPESYAACCEAIGAMDQTADLAAIVAPTLIIAGATDPVTPPAVAVALQERVSGSSLLVLAGAAHLANIEQPGSFTAAVVDHLIGAAFDRGNRTRREVLGDDHVDRSEADRTDFTFGFQDLITRYAWGEIWARPAWTAISLVHHVGHARRPRTIRRAGSPRSGRPAATACRLTRLARCCCRRRSTAAFQRPTPHSRLRNEFSRTKPNPDRRPSPVVTRDHPFHPCPCCTVARTRLNRCE